MCNENQNAKQLGAVSELPSPDWLVITCPSCNRKVEFSRHAIVRRARQKGIAMRLACPAEDCRKILYSTNTNECRSRDSDGENLNSTKG